MKSASQKSKEQLDVDLCYKGLGASTTDSPEQIEAKYRRLIETCKGELRSPDPRARENAKNQLVLFEDLYNKIKNSAMYQSTAKEYEKRNRERAPSPAADGPVMKSNLIHCPSCNAMIGKGLASCPVCKADFRTRTDKIVQNYIAKTPNLTTLSLVLVLLLVLVGALIFLVLMYPERFDQLLGLFRR